MVTSRGLGLHFSAAVSYEKLYCVVVRKVALTTEVSENFSSELHFRYLRSFARPGSVWLRV